MIIALLFNVCGAYIIFKSVKSEIRSNIKHKIKAGVPESELAILKFSIAEVESGVAGIEWIENHEFRFEGKMYDIVRTSYEGTTIIYHCINDVQEEVLFAHLNSLVNQAASTDKNSQQKTHHLLQLLIHEALQEFVTINQFSARASIQLSTVHENLTQVYIEIPTPPPHCG